MAKKKKKRDWASGRHHTHTIIINYKNKNIYKL